MPGLPARKGVSHEEYLAMEDGGTERHEFLRGEVFAMAGGTLRHAGLALALGAELRQALRQRPCYVSMSDFRLRNDDTDLTTYPDVAVWCGRIERSPHDRNAGINPLLLAEVLSPGTRDYDLGSKAAHYRRIVSLRHLLFVEPDEQRVQVWTREPDGSWNVRDVVDGEIVLRGMEVTLSVDALYAVPPGFEGLDEEASSGG